MSNDAHTAFEREHAAAMNDYMRRMVNLAACEDSECRERIRAASVALMASTVEALRAYYLEPAWEAAQ